MAMKLDMSALETNFAVPCGDDGDGTYFSAEAPDVPSMVLPTCADVSTRSHLPSPPLPSISPAEGFCDLPDSFGLSPGWPVCLPRSSTGSRRRPRRW